MRVIGFWLNVTGVTVWRLRRGSGINRAYFIDFGHRSQTKLRLTSVLQQAKIVSNYYLLDMSCNPPGNICLQINAGPSL